MRTFFLATGFFLFCAVSLNAQIKDSIRNTVDTFLNRLEQSVLEYEQNVDIAASTSTITAQDIQNRGYDNLDELISSVQGMYLTHDWKSTEYGMRGAAPGESNNRRVLILIDNIPLNDPITGRAPSGYELRGIPMEKQPEKGLVHSSTPVALENMMRAYPWDKSGATPLLRFPPGWGPLQGRIFIFPDMAISFLRAIRWITRPCNSN